MLVAIAYTLEGRNAENGNYILSIANAWAPNGRIDDMTHRMNAISGLLAAMVAAGREPLAVTLYGWPPGEKDPSLGNIQVLMHTPLGAAAVPRDVVNKAIEAAIINMPKAAMAKPTAHPEMKVPSSFNPLSN